MRAVVLIVVFIVATACGGKSSPTTPSPPPQPAAVAGDWTGNLESQNFAAVAVSVNMTQANDAVNGTWASSNNWNGIITGTTTPATFSGTFTVSLPAVNGGRCTGTASVSGAAGGATITWTSPGFAGSSCTGMPVNLRWNLQRR